MVSDADIEVSSNYQTSESEKDKSNTPPPSSHLDSPLKDVVDKLSDIKVAESISEKPKTSDSPEASSEENESSFNTPADKLSNESLELETTIQAEEVTQATSEITSDNPAEISLFQPLTICEPISAEDRSNSSSPPLNENQADKADLEDDLLFAEAESSEDSFSSVKEKENDEVMEKDLPTNIQVSKSEA